MKTALSILSQTVVAAEAIPQKHFVGFDGAVCAAGAKAYGVSYFDAVAGDALTLDVLGLLVVAAASAINVGDAVETGAGGTAVAHTDGAINGYAVSASVEAGDFIQIRAA